MATSRGSRLLDGKYRAILDYPKVLGLTPGLFLSSNFRPMGLPISPPIGQIGDLGV